MSKYAYQINDDKTECSILKPSRKAGTSPKYLGKVIIYGNGSKYRTERAEGVMWLPVNQALAELGFITHEQANLSDLGF